MPDIAKAARVKDRALQDAIHAVADRVEPDLREAFAQAVEEARGQISLRALTAAVQQADPQAILDALEFAVLIARLEDTHETLRGLYVSGGKTMAEALAAGYTGAAVEVRLDTHNPRVTDFLRQYRFDLIEGLSQQQVEAVRVILDTGTQAGLPPAALAREMRDAVGLNSRQANALSAFRRALVGGDAATATDRSLGPRLEGRVRRSVREGIDPETIRELTEGYRFRLLRQRTEVIARTETIRALSEGQQEVMRQAVENGALNGNTLRRYWLVTRDEKTCPICNGIAKANPDGVGLNEPFRSSKGPVMHPPETHPGCRCTLFYRTGAAGLLGELNPAPRLVTDRATGAKRYETLGESYRRKPGLRRRARK